MDNSVQRTDTGKKTKPVINRTAILVLIIWAALIGGGFFFVQYRIGLMQADMEQSVREVKETNALNINKLEEQVSGLEASMREIQGALEEADESIDSSQSANEALNTRIEELDKDLEELQETLDALKE